MKLFPDDPMKETYGIEDILKSYSDEEEPLCEQAEEKESLSPEEAGRKLDVLRGIVSVCEKCRLSLTRTNTVFGEGYSRARLMFIGEGPGADEDMTGRPFVGRAGQLLTKMINAMGLKREEVYIANIVKCRPPGNRNPDADEAASCIGYLKEQIKIVNPEFIICLGSVAVTYLFGAAVKITKVRGSWKNFEGCKTMLTYHPAFLLRSPERKKEAWADLQLVMKALEENKK